MANVTRFKPQWLFRMIGGAPFLTNEHLHHRQNPEHASLLSKLAIGVDSDTLSDEEFQFLESLNSAGFLTTLPVTDDEIGQFLWEFGGISQKTAADQLAHCTFKIITLSDLVDQADKIRVSLVAGGMTHTLDSPRLVVVLGSSYQELNPVDYKCALPVILGRTRCSVGPLMLPWRQPIRDQVATNESYLPEVRYTLPKPLVDLQIAWSVMTILRFVVSMTTPMVNNIVEYDMINQLQHKWVVA